MRGGRLGRHRYLLALGSNVRHPRHGAPRKVLAAAAAALDGHRIHVIAVSRTIETVPLGPSRRRYANAAAVVSSRRDPEALLRRLHRIERAFGRRRRGSAWGPRVLDLDIVLWSGGAFAGEGSDLLIPHRAFRARRFVLEPARAIAGDWRDPLSGLTVRHLAARLTRPRPHPR